jgi:rfaE bifunctional protein nucleotidyltransferase chain/domain
MSVTHRIDELQKLSTSYRSQGLSIGLCHGCFDIVHLGHIHHLRQASSMVDRLFVSVTDDEFVNKGPERPIFPGRIRAELVASIRYCDHVVVNRAATAELMISTLRPDIFFKGADYRSNADPRMNAERLLVERNGGRVILTDDAVLDSTSRIARAIVSGSALTAPAER